MKYGTVNVCLICVIVISIISFLLQALSLIPWDGDQEILGLILTSIEARSAYCLVTLLVACISIVCAKKVSNVETSFSELNSE